MRVVVVTFAIAVAFLVLKVVQVAGRIDRLPDAPPAIAPELKLDGSVSKLDEWFRAQWAKEGVSVSGPASDLGVFRRLSLALFGCLPSLEEIRAFEADLAPDRLDRWVARMLQDPRYGDYFGERLARSLVGTEDGPFIIFRRDRMTAWLSEQLLADTPWSDMTHHLIAAEGLWTDSPATNFITVARIDDEGLDENKLAGRTVRTFLGQRIDCAQCHDHPFDPTWRQKDFEGLAAFFCQANISLGGVMDSPKTNQKEPVVYKVVDPGKAESEARVISETVPFHSEWLPKDGGLRSRLAEWVTHKDNRRFERAIANRIWGFMFGKPLHEPVDDLPHPADGVPDALDLLGAEFRDKDDRLSVLVRMIAQSQVFRLQSESSAETEDDYRRQVKSWAVFPLVRLRPEQMIGSLFQAGFVRTVDQTSNPLIRLQRFGSENDFLKEYGDLGDDELLQQVGTIPQALLRLNGRFTNEISKADALSGPAEIRNFSPDDRAIVENSYLACLCRRPHPDELAFFTNLLQSGQQADNGSDAELTAQKADSNPSPARDRSDVVQDLFWTLFNSPEFSWNH